MSPTITVKLRMVAPRKNRQSERMSGDLMKKRMGVWEGRGRLGKISAHYFLVVSS